MSEAKSTKQAVAIIPEDQRIKYTVTPQPGRLMSAKAIGGQLAALYDLNRALGRQEGPRIKLHTAIIGISMEEDGSIAFELAIMEDKSRAEFDAAIAAERDAEK